MHYMLRAPPRAPAPSPPRSDHLHLLYAHQKLGEHRTQAPATRGTVSSELEVNVQDVARLCSRKSHVKVGRRLRAVCRPQLGWGWLVASGFRHLGHYDGARELEDSRTQKQRGGGNRTTERPRRDCAHITSILISVMQNQKPERGWRRHNSRRQCGCIRLARHAGSTLGCLRADTPLGWASRWDASFGRHTCAHALPGVRIEPS